MLVTDNPPKIGTLLGARPEKLMQLLLNCRDEIRLDPAIDE
jgi:hypothetical protein